MAATPEELGLSITGLRVTAIEEITGDDQVPAEEAVMAVEEDDLTMEEAAEFEDEAATTAIATSGVNNIRELLDDVDEQVERLRKAALNLIAEKENIHTVLDMLVQPEQLEAMGLSSIEREEIEATAVMLSQRLNGVDIRVSNMRSVDQLESLHSVNSAIDQLVVQIQTDSMEASLVCRQFLSAAGTAEIKSPPDCKFERMLLGCSVEDQKNVRRRLLGLLDHIKAITADSITETE